MNMNKKNNETLLHDFQATSKEDWREAAEQLLKGKPFDKVMTSSTPEGIRIEPIFRSEVLDSLPASSTLPGFDGYLRGTSAAGYKKEPWEIAQELPYGTAAEFNTAARADLLRGQNALNVLLDIATLKGIDPDTAKAGEVAACGLSLACLKDIEAAFDTIIPDAISFHFRSGCAGLSVGALFFAWLDKQSADFSQIRGSLGMDPLAVQAASGQLPSQLDELISEQAIMARYCAAQAPGIRAIGVASMPYHQAGASAVEELGICLATGAYYLGELIERGLSVDVAAQQIRFSFCIGPNFFMEIAKLRAARVLWAQIVQAFGGNADSQKIVMHARTGLYNKTQKDPYVNMLRTTTEALSGAIGGVDSMCVGNFDEVCRLPDTFSRRISRNTQVILQEECELTAVIDPAGGSWAVEWLTNEVSEKAWACFKRIEAEGGISMALNNGMIQRMIKATAQQNETALGTRRSSLIGTNVYPNLNEKPLSDHQPDYAQVREQRAREITAVRMELDADADAAVLEALGKLVDAPPEELVPMLVQAVRAGATIGEITKTIRASVEAAPAITPLPATRLAAKYEHLREASARFAAKTGRAPAIYLTNLGPLRRHKARADFTQGFFQTGGFEVMSPAGFESPDEAVAALVASDAGITVVCGTDEDYAAKFADYAQAIKAALPEMQVILAGFPGEQEPAYRAAGMDDYIFIKSDNYETNHRYLSGLGAL
ncbi:MAG: methylmalonyl-CoA mutase [Puniceicoccaceae bacterium]|nr:MAG: methylmalonyl-CoA mutase [Puniceicoccaceae bacterium]